MATLKIKGFYPLLFVLVFFLVGCGGAGAGTAVPIAVVNPTAVSTEPPPPTETMVVIETPEPQPSPTALTVPPPPALDFSGLVETAHGPMYLQCSGQGEGPVVILEAGLGNNATSWRLVERDLTGFSRVCSYNRLGGTGPDGEPRTAALAAEELHMLLETAGIPGPYILVGHSYGGYIIRLYTDRYPDEVVGLVFVDSSHEAQRQRMNEIMTPAEQEENRKRVRRLVFGVDFEASGVQVGETADFGERPVIVLTRGEWSSGLSFVSAETDERMYQEWIAMQAEIAALSTNSEQWFATESGHNIQLDQPELVVEAVAWVLSA